MGFFSNLKNSLTGSWADVSVSVPSATRGESVPITVHVTVKDDAIDIEKVVVQVHCDEIVEIADYAATGASTPATAQTVVGSKQSGASAPPSTARNGTTVDVKATESLFNQELQVAGAQQLAAGSQHTFEGSVALPAHLPPSLKGRNARFEWRVMASVAMRGNDPDSGWQTFEVR
jgi:hypothetical protein